MSDTESENKNIIEEKPKPKESDYSRVERRSNNPPVLLSDYEHKAYITQPQLKPQMEKPDDVLTKDLRLSFIDSELAWIYSIKLTCAEEWRHLGMPNLATRRMTALVGKLSLFASVKGRERLLQSNPAISLRDELGQESQPTYPSEENNGGGIRSKLGFGR